MKLVGFSREETIMSIVTIFRQSYFEPLDINAPVQIELQPCDMSKKGNRQNPAGYRPNSYTKHNLKHKFGGAIRALGLPPGCVFHGLRKTAAVMLAEAGCSTEQIKAITGHRTDQMAAYYAKRANQRVLAKAAMAKLQMNL
jgi:integrase